MNYIGKTKISKIASVVLSLTTILSLSGVAMILPVSVSAAVTIVDGDIIGNSDAEGLAAFDIYIVKLINGKKFKRLVLNPQVFESYEHLKWEDVKYVDATTMDSYTTSELVREDGGTRVYRLIPDGDTGSKEWLNMSAEEFALSYDWESIYTVNSTDIGNYNVGEDIVIVDSGIAGIALDAGTSAAGYVAQSTYNNEFTKIKFSAGSTGYIIGSLAIARSGLSADADLSDVRLFDGNTQLGSAQSMNSTTHKATFNNLNWTIPANGSKVLTVKGSVAANGTSVVGDVIKLGIASASDITVSSGTLPSATFPIYGNGKTIAGVAVGRMEVMASTAVSARDLISGTTDQLVGGFNFEAITEAFDVNKIVISEAGSAVSTDLTNVKIKVDGVQVGSTVASLTSGEKATFTGSPLFSVTAGSSKDIFIYVDIADGITSERTVQWQVFETDDVEAIGGNSGGITLIKGDSNATFTTISSPSSVNTIRQGAVSVTFDTATNPSDGMNTVAGAKDVLVQTFKFSATTREGLDVTYLKLDLNTDNTEVTATDYSNARLFIDDSTSPISTYGTIGSASVAFGTSGSSSPLFNVPKGGNVVAKLYVDISTTAAASDRIGYYISSTSNMTIYGVDSAGKIPAGSMTITAVDEVSDSGAGQLNINNKGTLTLADSPDKPAATTYSVGSAGLTVYKFRMTAEYEDMTVTMIRIRFWDAVSGTYTTAVDDTDFSNIRLYDGATLLDSVSLASGIATFNLTGFAVPKDGTKTLSVVIDVPVGSALTNDSLYLTVGNVTGTSGITTAGELTTTGASSLQAITELPATSTALSNAFTPGVPSFTIAVSTTPAARSMVAGATLQHVGKILVTANNENIKVTSVRVAAGDADLASTDGSAATTNWSQIRIKVNGSDISGGGPKSLTDGGSASIIDYVVFNGLNFTINKDTTSYIDIYADAVGSSSSWYFGITDSASQIVGAGVGSGTSVSGGAAGSIYASQAVTLTDKGGVTLSVDADTPVSQNVAVGTGGATGVNFSKIKFEASNIENLVVKKVRLTLSGGAAADFASIKLYDGGSQIGSDAYISGTTVDFIDDTNGLFSVAAGTSKIITVKADLNGTTGGGDAVSGDGPRLYIASVTGTLDGTSGNNINLKVTGFSSAQNVAGTAGTPTPVTDTNFGAITIYKSVPTVSLNSSSPSGAQSPGTGKEVLRFNVAADSKGDVVFNQATLKVSGNISQRTTTLQTLNGSGNAEIYKSDNLSTPLAYAPYVAGTAAIGGSTTTATADSSSANPFAGIPVGAHVRITNSSDSDNYFTGTYKVTASTDVTNVATLTFTPATSQAIGASDVIYYRPMEPGVGTGAGKLFFGGQSALGADLASGDATITVASTDGFAPGDVISVTGYNSSGVAITDSAITVKGITSATVLAVDAATTLFASGPIDYDYNWSVGDTADLAVVWVTTRKNDAGTSVDAYIGEQISGGTSKTFIVKGDTTGADSSTGTETLGVNFDSIADFNWDDLIRFGVTTLTAGLPLLGGTLSY